MTADLPVQFQRHKGRGNFGVGQIDVAPQLVFGQRCRAKPPQDLAVQG